MYDAPPAHATLIDNMWQLHTSGKTGGSSRSVSWRWQETSRGMTAVLTIKQERYVKVKRVNWDRMSQWVQVYTLNMLYVPCTIVQCLWVFDWKLQIRWLYSHLSKWGSQCYMRKEEDRSSYTNDHRFCILKEFFFKSFVEFLAYVGLFYSHHLFKTGATEAPSEFLSIN